MMGRAFMATCEDGTDRRSDRVQLLGVLCLPAIQAKGPDPKLESSKTR